jgi:spore coat polysaccharide biosynthesis protein SpsF (cytidylyltransferase family)
MPKAEVCIGIQARSTSERLPNKIFADIAGKPMLAWVLEAARDAAMYLNRNPSLAVSISVLAPKNDPRAADIEAIAGAARYYVNMVYGPEHNVLERYHMMATNFNADYIVRITGDCPCLYDAIITKAVNCATMNKLDYVSNVDESCRVAFDGMDVEVISRRLLEYVYDKATLQGDLEHVTTLIRRECPKDFKVGAIFNRFDSSSLKLSVDTEEDLQRVRANKGHVERAMKWWEDRFGKGTAFRF